MSIPRHFFRNPTHLVYVLVHASVILLGFLLIFVRRDSTLLEGIGASLVAAGLSGYIIFVYVLASKDVSDKLALLTKFGMASAFEARGVRMKQEYDKRLEQAHRHIDVMGFGLRSLREDYGKQFAEWKQRAPVRILLLDPDFPNTMSPYASQRDLEEKNAADSIRNDIHQFIDATKELTQDTAPNRFQIRLYRCLPSVNVFRVDNELFWGPYLMHEQSRNTATFLVRNGGVIFEQVEAHFNEIWNSDELSRSVPKGW